MFDSNRTIKLVTKNRLMLWLNNNRLRTISNGSVCPLRLLSAYCSMLALSEMIAYGKIYVCICDIDNERIDCDVGKKALKFIKCILIIIKRRMFFCKRRQMKTFGNFQHTKPFGNFWKIDGTTKRGAKKNPFDIHNCDSMPHWHISKSR